MIKKLFSTLGMTLGATYLLAACGQGLDPIDLMGDPTQSQIGVLSLPIAASTSGFASFIPFSSSNPGFTLNTNTGFTQYATQIVAPGTGVVAIADIGGQSVTIEHTIHVRSRITGVTSSVQVGNYVYAGTQIGTAVSSGTNIQFSVLVDGVAVCPLSYLTTAARVQLTTSSFYGTSTQSPCTN